MTSKSKLIHRLLAATGFAAIAPTAFAQEAPPTDRDVVIVTATKQSESLQEVAASVSALGEEALEERGISSVETLQYAVPSFQAGTLRAGGGSAITIRGVGLNLGSPGVAVHVNGIYQTRSDYALLSQLDLQQVEVLRGPQGTLYGRNANGGVVNFITHAPEDFFSAEFLAGYAEYDEQHLQAIVNTPIADGVRSRVALDYARRGEGFTKNIAGGQDLDRFESFSGRGTLSVDFGPDAVLDLGLAMSHETGPTSSFQLNSLPNAEAIARNPYLATTTFALEPWTTTANDPSDSERDYMEGSAILTWDLGFAKFKSLSGYTSFTDDYRTDSDTADVSAFPQTNSAASTSFTQEINLSNAGDVFDWVLGAYYLKDNSKQSLTYDFNLGLDALPPGSYIHFNNPVRDTEARAVFADGTWHATDALNVMVGVRYSEEEQVYTYTGEVGAMFAGQRFPFLTLCPMRTDTPSFSSLTPRAGVQYFLGADQNLYATFSKGFKSGGVNTVSCNNEFKPEKITAYEAGYRSQWFGGDVTFNASGFYYDYTDLQLSQITGLTLLITNAAAAEVYGVELETAWALDERWTLNGNLSLLDATYANFTNVDTLNPMLGPQDVSGNYLNNSPKVSANVGVAYKADLLGGKLSTRIDVSYRSKVFFREFNQPLDSQDDYTVLNGALSWVDPSDVYTVRLYVKNAGNEAYITRMGSSDGFGSRYVAYGAPRQIGLELKARY